MKKFLLFLLIAFPACAELEFVSLFGTNQVNTNQVIDLTTNFMNRFVVQSTRVDFQFNYQLQASGIGVPSATALASFVMQKSMDGTNWLALATYVLPVSTNGVATVYPTNVTLGTYNYVGCAYVTNTTTAQLTNVAVFATFKQQYYP